MEKSIIGEQNWAEMTEGQKVDAVVAGRATLKQMSEGLLDGSELLRAACRTYLAHTAPSFENLAADAEDPHDVHGTELIKTAAETLETTRQKLREAHESLMQRFSRQSQPDPRQHYARRVLIEQNIYRLPNGQEFIPCRPTGTLGARQHTYALVTCEQFLKGKRGSVYVRSDGRIFDYSVDSQSPFSEIFETGYTIADLERTGRYAPERKRRRKRRKPLKAKRAAASAK